VNYETILVLYVPEVGIGFPVDALRAYSKFVSPRSYLIVLGTVLGQPWLGYSKRWYLFAIDTFLPDSGFKIDAGWDQDPLSTCAFGYLRRVDAGAKYDASPDQLDTFESNLA
jgi:hypothetical protein